MGSGNAHFLLGDYSIEEEIEVTILKMESNANVPLEMLQYSMY